jgi:hypothetical protein
VESIYRGKINQRTTLVENIKIISLQPATDATTRPPASMKKNLLRKENVVAEDKLIPLLLELDHQTLLQEITSEGAKTAS